MNQGNDNAMPSMPGRQSEYTHKSLKQQFPAKTKFLLEGETYRLIQIGLDQLQLIAKALKKGASNG